MQIILTEDEYNDLLRKTHDITQTYLTVVQELCTEVANHKPINYCGNKEKMPWVCMLNDDDNEWVCDECPVQHICPHEPKEWSQ